MLAARFLGFFAIALVAAFVVLQTSRRATLLPVPVATSRRPRQWTERPVPVRGEFWFQAACRCVWTLMLAGLSLVGALATL